MALSYDPPPEPGAPLEARKGLAPPPVLRALFSDRADKALFCIPTIASSCRPNCASHLQTLGRHLQQSSRGQRA